MELALITAQQVIILFLLIGCGFVAVKTGVLKQEGKQTLSNLLLYLVVPAMIVHSYMMEFSEEILHNLLAAFGMSVLAILIGTAITLALILASAYLYAYLFAKPMLSMGPSALVLLIAGVLTVLLCAAMLLCLLPLPWRKRTPTLRKTLTSAAS